MRTSDMPLAVRQRKFPIGAKVRYRPGSGTYGYEDALEEDGRLAGVVIAHTATRVRVKLTINDRLLGTSTTIEKSVDGESLKVVAS